MKLPKFSKETKNEMEMGQHCLINQIQANLMYNDGTCYDERLPQGITGWIYHVQTVQKQEK